MGGSVSAEAFVCAASGNLEGLLTTIDKNDKFDINDHDEEEFRYTALHHAARHNHVNIADWLLKNGANVNSRNEYGFTPLHVASARGSLDVVKVLLSNGASVDTVTENEDKETSLHIAVREDQVATAKYFLESRADYNKKDMYGYDALHFSRSDAMEELLSEYLLHGQEMNYKVELEDDVAHGKYVKPISISASECATGEEFILDEEKEENEAISSKADDSASQSEHDEDAASENEKNTSHDDEECESTFFTLSSTPVVVKRKGGGKSVSTMTKENYDEEDFMTAAASTLSATATRKVTTGEMPETLSGHILDRL